MVLATFLNVQIVRNALHIPRMIQRFENIKHRTATGIALDDTAISSRSDEKTA